jgi:subtilisin family serine protease
MKRNFTLLLAALFSLLLIKNLQAQNNKLTGDLLLEISKTQQSEKIRINIRLAEQFDVAAFDHVRQIMHPEQLRSYVVSELKSFSAQTQEPLVKELNALRQTGEVSQVKSLWIANVINCYASPDAIMQLAQNPDIERIDYDEERILINPLDVVELGEDHTREITYNVNIMNVPQVWDMGFTGEGIVVAVLDTGVNYNHEDLKNNMWTHPEFPFHGWNFVNNNNNPMDYNGHGTHCAGTVAGDGSAGSQTGMAPSAKIMALQVLGGSGGGTESGVWEAIEFSVEYGAHIMSLSLGWQHVWNPDRASWRNAMDNALAAGVIASVASGNEGGSNTPSNVRTPGDNPAPWRNPDQPDTGLPSAVVTIGATDAFDNIAGFSSRGPVTWEAVIPYNDYPYNPGTGLITPDVSAPGVDVKSLSHNNTSGYTSMSGTSMAAPGAAGVMALILSKNPRLKPVQLSQILEETAMPKTPIKGNTYGAGRVDALEAILNTNFPGPIYVAHSVNDDEGNNDGLINPEEFIKLDFTLLNDSEIAFHNIVTTITTESPYVTLVNSEASFGSFEPGETIEIENAFSFNTTNNIPGGHQIVFRVESTDGNEVWINVFRIMAYAPNLEISSLSIDDTQGNGNGQLDPGELVDISFDLFNNGQLDAVQPVITISTLSPFITISNQNISLENIPPSSSQTITTGATINAQTPVGTMIDLVCNIEYGNYLLTKTYYLRTGLEVEDFETGDFSKLDWNLSGHQPWQITSVDPYQGSYSAKSGAVGHNQMSVMSLQYEVSEDDIISFYLRVSSETTNDFLRFYINGQRVADWSGEVAWQKASFPVSAGMATFTWIYRKNNMLSVGEDAAWIDIISLPLAPVTAAWAGFNAAICEDQTHQLNGVANHYNSIAWTSSGNGSFSNPAIPDPVYTPGQQDIDDGEVILTLTVIGEATTVADDLLLEILKLPDAPLKPAGPDSVDLHKVSQSVYQIETVENADSYEWLLDPAEAGELTLDGTQLTIDWEADFLGEAKLKVIAMNDCGQSEASEELDISLFSSVGIAEISLLIMRVYPNPSDGRFTIEFNSRIKTDGLVLVSNMLGETVYSEPIAIDHGSFSHSLDLERLSQGIYNLMVLSDQGKSSNRILIFR